MYEFVDNIAMDDYILFYKENNGCFMQSYEWGQFNEISRNQVPHYVGLKKNGKLVCEALLLEKKGPLKLSYFYSPRGFIIDFNNRELVKLFIEELKKFIKSKNGIYLKFDPEIEYQDIDSNGNSISNGNNNYDIYNSLMSLGLVHTGFVKNFENNQPRYTFLIDLNKDEEELYNNIDKSIRKKINKTYDYDMVLRQSDDVNTFFKLLSLNSEKDNFMPYKKEYYEKAYKMLNGTYKLFELVINPKKLYQKLEGKLKLIDEELNSESTSKKDRNNLEESKKRAQKELGELSQYKDKTELVICSQMCAVTNTKVYTLYIGNNEIGKNLYAVNRMYWEIIKYSKQTNHIQLDLFGTTGNPNTSEKNYQGIHKFKQNFGGRYVEFIGEFDYVNKRISYKVLPYILKMYRKCLKFVYKLKKK